VLESIQDRLALEVRGKPYFEATITPGISLGYRRLEGRAGSWSARLADGAGGNRIEAIGVADDLEPANGRDILSFEQAYDKARTVTRAAVTELLTVNMALERYAAELKARGGLAGNVSRVRHHLPRGLAAKNVSAVTAGDLRAFRDGIKAAPATVNRTIRILKAALNQVAEANEELSTNAWRVGLKQKPNAHQARNVVLSDEQVRDVVAAAYAEDAAFGLFVEVAAVTGARPSQIARLEVRDLQADRVMMPTSKKGTGDKPRHIRVPVTLSLAAKLKVAAAGRAPTDALLVRSKGDAWTPTSNDHRLPFQRAAKVAGLDPEVVTIYALRHSSIVRRIKANKTPLRTIAAIHDTSVVMIERNYSRDIDQCDASVREGLLDTSEPMADNVVALRA